MLEEFCGNSKARLGTDKFTVHGTKGDEDFPRILVIDSRGETAFTFSERFILHRSRDPVLKTDLQRMGVRRCSARNSAARAVVNNPAA